MPEATCIPLLSVPVAAGILLYPPTPSITYSICLLVYMLISFDKANSANRNQWNNHWLGLKVRQYGSLTFFFRPRGLFVLHAAAAPAPPLPPPTSAQAGANGHISHLQQRPSEHKQFCLPPQPFMLTMATAPCPNHGPSCISGVGVRSTLELWMRLKVCECYG